MNKWYTVNDIASKLSIDPQKVRKWIREGKLKAVRGEGKTGYSIREDDLRAFVESDPKLCSRALMSEENAYVQCCLEMVTGIRRLQAEAQAYKVNPEYGNGWDAAMQSVERLLSELIRKKSVIGAL